MLNKMQVTATEAEAAAKEFVAQVMLATGADGVRARFKDFAVKPEIFELAEKGLSRFVMGDFAEALKCSQDATKWLLNCERGYCMNAVNLDAKVTMEDSKKFFDRAINALPRLDAVLTDELKSHYVAFVQIAETVRVAATVKIEDASACYWALLDVIDAAPKKQELRNHELARQRDAEKQKAYEVKMAAGRKQRQQVAQSFVEQLRGVRAQMRA